MLVVDYQSKPTLFGITGHTIGIVHWIPLVMCENCPCSFMGSWALTAPDFPESICNPWLWWHSDHWTKASQLVTDKSQEAGERIKASWEANINKQWGSVWSPDSIMHARCRLIGDQPCGQAGEKKSGQCMARPCHRGLIKKTADHLSVQYVYFSRTASYVVRRWAIIQLRRYFT